MAVYYFTIVLLTGSGWIITEKKMGKKVISLYIAGTFLLLVLLASFRYAIGFDYFSYQNIYEMASQLSVGEILSVYRMEPLYFIVCKLFSLTGCSYPVFLIFINLFLMACAMQFIRCCSQLPWISVYLFICLQFFAHDMNLIRQSIAVSFFLLAWPSIKSRKLLPYTFLILIGGLFHNSLLFIYPLYFLLPKKLGKKSLAALSMLALTIYFFFDPLFHIIRPFLPLKYANYLGSYYWNPNSFSFVLLPMLYCLLIYLFRNRIADPFQRTVYLNSAFFTCVINLFITKHFILERFAVYPFIFSLTAIPEIICSYQNKEDRHTDASPASNPEGDKRFKAQGNKKERSRKPLLTYRRTLLLFLIFGLVYFMFAAAKEYHHVYPYISLLDKSCSSPD